MKRINKKAFVYNYFLIKYIFFYLYLLTPPSGVIEGGAITGWTNGPVFFSLLFSELMEEICIIDINSMNCFVFIRENIDFIFRILFLNCFLHLIMS
jgi:hypothetical protein